MHPKNSVTNVKTLAVVLSLGWGVRQEGKRGPGPAPGSLWGFKDVCPYALVIVTIFTKLMSLILLTLGSDGF